MLPLVCNQFTDVMTSWALGPQDKAAVWTNFLLENEVQLARLRTWFHGLAKRQSRLWLRTGVARTADALRRREDLVSKLRELTARVGIQSEPKTLDLAIKAIGDAMRTDVLVEPTGKFAGIDRALNAEAASRRILYQAAVAPKKVRIKGGVDSHEHAETLWDAVRRIK